MKNRVFFLAILANLLCTSFITESKIGSETEFSNALEIEVIKTSDGFDALDISFDINADLATFIKVINDVDNYRSWVYRCQNSEQLSSSISGVIEYRNTFDFPFPFMDRQLSVESTQHIKDGVFYSSSKPAKIQRDDPNFVNIEVFESLWEVSPREEGGIHVEYFVRSTPGGAIPAFLYNMAVKEGPRRTILNLIQLVESKDKMISSK